MPEPSVGRVREEGESSRRNPLVDLIESENVYVEELGLLVRVSVYSLGIAELNSVLPGLGPGKTCHHQSWIQCFGWLKLYIGRTRRLAW